MKYEVQTKYVFSGTFTVEADSPAKAKEYVENHCGLVMGGNIHTTLEDCEWDILTHPEVFTGRARKVQ